MRNTSEWPADDIETLISQYGDMLFRLCLIMLKNESDAEDAFQYLHNPMVHCFECMRVNSLEESKKAVLERSKNKEFYFAITLKENGKGYAYEAAHAFFDYLFGEKGARRIYAYTEDYNLSSQKLCEKLGMRREGMFMEFVSFINDENGNPIYENTCQYAILKKEWEKRNNL